MAIRNNLDTLASLPPVLTILLAQFNYNREFGQAFNACARVSARTCSQRLWTLRK
jgi:hypothetical protein